MSAIGKLTAADWKKVGTGALVAGAGAVITYLIEWSGTVDFGTYTPLVAAASAVLVNVVRKWLTITSSK